MFFRHSYDKLIYPLLVLIVLAAISYRPKYHLRGDMPPEFFPPTATTQNATKRSLDHKIAWAYWESAQMDIQWKYPHGKTLPPDPPAEFRVNARALGPEATDAVTRQLYWRRLQQVWYAPSTWQKQYEWDMSWAGDPFMSGGQSLKEHMQRLMR